MHHATRAALGQGFAQVPLGQGLSNTYLDTHPALTQQKTQAHTGLADHHCCHLAKGLQVHCVVRGMMVAGKGLRKMEKKAQENYAPKGLPLLWYQLPLLHPHCIAF